MATLQHNKFMIKTNLILTPHTHSGLIPIPAKNNNEMYCTLHHTIITHMAI
jgi:hypothetical protein